LSGSFPVGDEEEAERRRRFIANELDSREGRARRITPLRETNNLARPPRGWIKAIREALGMTTAQLAGRIGVSQPHITQLEKSEIRDSLTLKTLRQVAEGLNCTLVYALVPNAPLDDLVRDRARLIADRQLARTDHTMKLENQALAPRELRAERERLVEALIAGNPRRLWDAP
jgi:predicted DNA-binding mobile mystery protein A